eukprot:gene1821-1107_t
MWWYHSKNKQKNKHCSCVVVNDFYYYELYLFVCFIYLFLKYVCLFELLLSTSADKNEIKAENTPPRRKDEQK